MNLHRDLYLLDDEINLLHVMQGEKRELSVNTTQKCCHDRPFSEYIKKTFTVSSSWRFWNRTMKQTSRGYCKHRTSCKATRWTFSKHAIQEFPANICEVNYELWQDRCQRTFSTSTKIFSMQAGTDIKYRACDAENEGRNDQYPFPARSSL